MPLSKLRDNELWKRIKGLQGQTIYTLKRRQPNKILRVTDNAVVIENRKSKPSRKQICELYHLMYEKKEVTTDSPQEFTLAVTYAILVKAVPDEIEDIPEKTIRIRLRGHST